MNFDSDRLSHAYITDESFADTLAAAVVCSTRNSTRPCKTCADCNKASRHIHPDITTVGKLDEKLIVTVDQIRALKKDVYIVPNEATQKAYIVKDADSMNANAQNAFLQILEEPPAHAVFILCTDNAAALLPTVRSRCMELKSQNADVSAEDNTEFEELKELVKSYIEAITGDNIKLMECMFRIDKLDRLALGNFLTLAREQAVFTLRKKINANIPEKSNQLVQAEEILLKAEEMLSLNVSAGHISGYICSKPVQV